MQFQVPKNQQNPSDHDKLETSDASCHNFQTILKICTVNFQIMEKPKKRYIIRTYTQGSGRNVLTITGNGPTERAFRNQRQFLKNVERDFCSAILRKLTAYMRPVPIVPSLTRIFIYGSHKKRLATYCNLRQLKHRKCHFHHAMPTFAKLCQVC